MAGTHNTAVGGNNGGYGMNGTWNTALGGQFSGNGMVWYDNIAIGGESAWQTMNGNRNVAIGGNMAGVAMSWTLNVAIGTQAGVSMTTGNSNIYLGSYAVGNANQDNQFSIGNVIYGSGMGSAGATNGKVGIGTSTLTSTAKLEVAGTVKITGGVPGVGKVLTSDATGLASWTTPSVAITGWQTNYGARWLTATTLGTGSVFDNGTNVGIGTATPESKLQTIGSMYVNTTADATGGFYYGPSGLIIGRYSTSPWPGSNWLYVGGNVGIGTTAAPAVKLDVAWQIRTGRDGIAGSYDTTSSTTTQSIWAISPSYDLNWAAATAFGNLYGMSYSYDGYGGIAGFGHQIGFHSNGTRNAAISLDNGNAFFNGNVGIGTSAPTQKLDVNWFAIIGDTASSNLWMRDDESTTGPKRLHANSNLMWFLNGAGSWMSYWDNAGNQWNGGSITAIGAMYTPIIYDRDNTAFGIDPAGVSTVNRIDFDHMYDRNNYGYYIDLNNASVFNVIYAAQFLYNSDRRLKQNIIPIKNSLAKITSLNGYTFDWKKDGTHDIGVIAQEVEKVFPTIVHTDEKTGMKSVEYGNLVAPIVEAIKELNTNISNNTAEIEALRSENAALKNRLDAIEARLAQ
jgi:Chaperone of endosialidase